MLEVMFSAALAAGRCEINYPHLVIKEVNDQLRSVFATTLRRSCPCHPAKGIFSGGLTNPSFGWSQIVGPGLEVRQLPVYPKGMLVEPFCRLLAETAKSCLQGV